MAYDTIIIGGGIAGTAAAYNLARSGVKTLLIDRHDTGRATDAGAGILSFATLGLGGGRAWFDFAMQCSAFYARLIEQLRDEQAGETGYAVVGELIVAVDEDEISAFETERRLISAQQEKFGLPAADDIRAITRTEAGVLFPPLAPVQRALLIRSSARVDGRLLTAAMRQVAEAKGLTIKSASVERLVIENGAVTGVVVADGETITAGKVIIAGGAWSQAFGEQLSLRIPVYPLRGQIIHLSLPGTDTSRWPMVHAFHGHYSVSWGDSRVAVGATRESVGFNPQPTAAGVREVLDEALRVAPGLADAELKEIRVGLRPACEDGLPVIGPVPNVENVFVATAFAAIGLQLGPFSGKLAADWVQGIESPVDSSMFSPGRFL